MGDRSVSARDVKNSVVVTGDGNTLSFGDTGIMLPLRRKQFPPPDRRRPREGEPARELDLLVADSGRLPLIGRHDLRAELQAWCDDVADVSVHALIGRAGTGKTRLAIEFRRAIDNDPAGKGEWVAGFLSPTDLNTVVETLATHNFAWERQTLLVVDYAAQCHEASARWLDRLALTECATRLRILLLDREAPEAFGWWQALTVLGPPSRRDLFHTLRPRQLPDLSDLEERRALMTAALQAACELRPRTPASTLIPPCGAEADFDRRLAQAQFGNPLNLVMAGVIALDRGPQAALALRRLDAARQIARRELRRLADLARSRHIGNDTMRHIVAFNGLAGGLPIADLGKTIAEELAVSGRPTDRISEIVELLEQEFPPLSGATQKPRLATIQPDLIGEAVIGVAFTGGPSQEAEAAEVARRAYALTRDAAAQSLIRLVQDFAYSIEDPSATDAERSGGRRVMGWLLNLADKIDDPDQLVPLVLSLPERTTILREPAAALTQKLSNYFLNKTHDDNDLVAVIYSAALLNNLANRLSALGRREDALTAAEEAVEHYRALAEARPDAFGAEFARCLWVFGDLQGGAGKPDLAVGTLAEAVRHLTPTFIRIPDAVVGMMGGIGQSYLSQCEADGREPDMEMLGPVIAVFEKLKEQEEK
jgi:hypothetical protein